MSRTERGSKMEDRRSKMEDRRSKMEDRRLRMEDRRWRIEEGGSVIGRSKYGGLKRASDSELQRS
jgi:hypothetical protein